MTLNEQRGHLTRLRGDYRAINDAIDCLQTLNGSRFARHVDFYPAIEALRAAAAEMEKSYNEFKDLHYDAACEEYRKTMELQKGR